MPVAHTDFPFAGCRILVAEDTLIVAETIQFLLRKRQCQVVGPFPTVAEALQAVRTEQNLTGALLDINLNGELIYPAAHELARRNIPFIFLTGYAAASLAEPFKSARILEKPFSANDFDAAFRGAFCPPDSQNPQNKPS